VITELGGPVFEFTHDLIGDLFSAKNAGVTPSPRRGAGGALECSTQDCVVTSGRRSGLLRRYQPCAAISPLQCHAGYCNDIPGAVGAHGDGTLSCLPLCLVRIPVDGTLGPAHERRPDSQPLHHHPRSRSCTSTGSATMSRLEQDSPGRSPTPWHCSPRLHT
jgi:hypothetical protein